MAKKSDNIKGNPYHDENTGQFTSENGENISNNIKVKVGLTSEKIQSLISSRASFSGSGNNFINPNGSLADIKTIDDANKQGAQILGIDNVVWYDNTVPVDNAKEFNSALNDITRDFGNCLKNGLLVNYGVSDRSSQFENDIAFQNNVLNRVSDALSTDTMKNIFNTFFSETNYKLFLSKMISNLKNNCNLYFGTLKSFSVDGDNFGFGQIDSKEKLKVFGGAFSIRFNYNGYTKHFSQNSSMISAHDGNFHLKTNKSVAYDTAAHELGHFVSYQCFRYMDESDIDKLKSLFKTSNSGTKNVSITSLVENGEISKYAATGDNGIEHIAEAFADVYSNGTSAQLHNKRIVNFFKEINDRIK